ncbi:MAG: vWA domain-containing protein [bacterium]
MNSAHKTYKPPGHRLFGFLEHLRNQGYVIGVGETADIIKTATASVYPDPAIVKASMRALCCRNQEDFLQFERHYIDFWHPLDQPPSRQDVVSRIDPRLRRTNASGIAGSSSKESEHGQQDLPVESAGAGRNRSVGKADFRFLSDKAAMREAELMAEQLGRQLRKQLSRRRILSPRTGQLDIRRMLRCSLATGGFPTRMWFSQRKLVPLHLVVLHDVSHSMTWNNPLLFRFVRGLLQTFPDASAYAFHTRLFPVSNMFRETSLKRMRARLESKNNLWMGGTCIASSLQYFNRQFAPREMKSKSTVLIISDGFDTDNRESLQHELDILRSNARKIIWLNPMLGRPGVSLDPSGLKHDLPMVDRFMPANSVEALCSTIREIGRG